MIMKYSSELFTNCRRRGDFGKYVNYTDILSGMKEDYKTILENSSNFYWTFYYEKHHSNGDTIFLWAYTYLIIIIYIYMKMSILLNIVKTLNIINL